jgi:hypothetical protein
VGVLGAALFSLLFHFASGPDKNLALSLLNAGIEYTVLSFANVAWCLRASGKLGKKEWTIQTKPPGLKDEAREEVPTGATEPANRIIGARPTCLRF